jgi:Na+-transporting NADH:ubiquinone oxidoreductase subunit B
MKFLQDIFDKLRPEFEKGGKFEALYPLFEAKETFLFTPRERTTSGAHVRDRLDSKRMMSVVIMALVPCVIFGMYNIGYQYYLPAYLQKGEAINPIYCMMIGFRYMMPIVIVSYAVGGIWELIFAVVRKHEINEGFLVTGILFPLTLPPTMPLWQVALGISFGVVIGKEVFGGTGMNIFNPALVARGFCFFAFPASISGEGCWRVAQPGVDGVSGATPMLLGTQDGQTAQAALDTFAGGDYSLLNICVGLIPGSIGEVSVIACLIGAVVLIGHGIGSWRIMLSCVIGAFVMWAAFYFFAAPTFFDGHEKEHTQYGLMQLPFLYHICMGGFMFGAVFMATDPVSASQTNTGKWIYGFLIGAIAILIRLVSPAYQEGMMLAILFMNAFAPLIDYYVVQANIKRRRSRVQG